MAKTIQVAMSLDAKKKHSVLFKPDADEKQPAITGFYLMNHAFEELDSPKKITLTVEST